jgi:hypothetical protein
MRRAASNRFGRDLDFHWAPRREGPLGDEVSMKLGLILAAAVALLVSGCGMADCSGAATNGAAGGACGLHATFFSERAAAEQTASFRKS